MKAISTAFAALAFTAMMAGPGGEAKAFHGSGCDGGFFVFDIFTGVTDVFFGRRGCYRERYYEGRPVYYQRRHYRRYR